MTLLFHEYFYLLQPPLNLEGALNRTGQNSLCINIHYLVYIYAQGFKEQLFTDEEGALGGHFSCFLCFVRRIVKHGLVSLECF